MTRSGEGERIAFSKVFASDWVTVQREDMIPVGKRGPASHKETYLGEFGLDPRYTSSVYVLRVPVKLEVSCEQLRRAALRHPNAKGRAVAAHI